MSSNDNTSTFKSAVDTATGYVQSGIAAVTGSAGDKAKADEYKDKAAAESDLSHTAAKAGPFAISSSGALAKDSPDRTQGSWDQTVGSAKETVGNLVGSEDLKQQGREQNLQGQGQEAKGQLSDLGKGVSDRAQGAVGGAVAALTGDRAEQAKYQDLHDEGKTRQRGVELDLDKQAAAQQK
ncbi:putative mismatched base pair and cruciform DNA recognition protein [Cladophialophora carrionii]|uniref:Putative mismatched base pair and cruciform DNA recognition protein n=1 Tax=Cladophialophora carrionii TaxID=86049 RepID=A0A1C1CHF9_9EURO|nr:putative mismatched base pair and cruciform DNA recognition protein [Cladophialophora carrionii]